MSSFLVAAESKSISITLLSYCRKQPVACLRSEAEIIDCVTNIFETGETVQVAIHTGRCRGVHKLLVGRIDGPEFLHDLRLAPQAVLLMVLFRHVERGERQNLRSHFIFRVASILSRVSSASLFCSSL